MGQDSGGLFKKGAAIRSPGRCSLWATASQAPRIRWGGSLAIVFGATNPTAMLSLGANDAREFNSAGH